MEILIFLGVVAVISFGVIALTRKADATRPTGIAGGKPREPANVNKK